MPRPQNSIEQRKEKILCLVNAVNQIIDNEGMEKVSIRKIAKITGYNSATIYIYFNDLEHLILFTTIGYFKEYNDNLYKYFTKSKDDYQNLIYTWQMFCEMVFTKPHIFYQMFFGKHCDDLEKVIKEYYMIFPSNSNKDKNAILKLLDSGDILRRNYIMLEPLVASGRVPRVNANEINEIILFCFKEMLLQKCKLGDGIDNKILISKLIAYIKIIIPYNYPC